MIEKATYREAQLQPLEDAQQEVLVTLVENLINEGKVSVLDVNLVYSQIRANGETALAIIDDGSREIEALKSDPVHFKKALLSDLSDVLGPRFNENAERHSEVEWDEVYKALKGAKATELVSLGRMESSGGEPDLLYRLEYGGYSFFDFSKEMPVCRRNLSYPQALQKTSKMGLWMADEHIYKAALEKSTMDEYSQTWLKCSFFCTLFGRAKVGCGKDWFIEKCSKFDINPRRGFRTFLEIYPK